MAFEPRELQTYILNAKEEVLDRARRAQNLGGIECDRDFRLLREKFIRGKILNHQKLIFEWAYALNLEDDSLFRVNGQHSSQVFLDMTDEDWSHVRFPIWIAEALYECDNAVDRAYLFNQFDPKESGRSQEDNIGVHLALYDEIKKVSRYAANKATLAILWYLRQTLAIARHVYPSHFDIIHGLPETHDFLRFADRILRPNKTPELSTKPVVAAMYHMTRHGDELALEFWKQVAMASLLDSEGYPAILVDYLEKAAKPNFYWSKADRAKFANGTKPNDKEVFQACLRMYHAERLGTPRINPIDRLRDRTVPEIIERYRIPEGAD